MTSRFRLSLDLCVSFLALSVGSHGYATIQVSRGSEVETAAVLILSDAGAITDGDEIEYPVSIQQLGVLRAYTEGDVDTEAYLTRPDGTLLVSNDDVGTDRNSELTFPVAPGRYVLRMHGAAYRSTGNFRLYVEFTPAIARSGTDKEQSSGAVDSRNLFVARSVTDESSIQALAVGDYSDYQVTGNTSGTVWGSGPYTSDSDIATAAVHAGLVAVGQTATIRVTQLPGESSYQGSTQNGVTTNSWGQWGSSIALALGTGANTPPRATLTVSPLSVQIGDTVHVTLEAWDDGNMDVYAVRHVDHGGVNDGGIGAGTGSGSHFKVEFDYIIPVGTRSGYNVFRAEVGDAFSEEGNELTYGLDHVSVLVGEPMNSPPSIEFNGGPTSLTVDTSGTWSYGMSDENGGLEAWRLQVLEDRPNGAVIYDTDWKAIPSISRTICNRDVVLTFDRTGSYIVRMTVKDDGSEEDTSSTPVTVTPPLTPTITSGNAAAILGGSIYFAVTATNSPHFSFSAVGLPPGLTINSTTGVITGTPTQLGGPYCVDLIVTNAYGTGTATMEILIISGSVSGSIEMPTQVVRPVSGSVNHEIKLKGFSSANNMNQYWYRILSPGPNVTVLQSGDWTDFTPGQQSTGGTATKIVVITPTTLTGTYTVELRVKTASPIQEFPATALGPISRPFEVVPLLGPVALSPTLVGPTGFTANWKPVDGATGYQLDVSTTGDFSEVVFNQVVGNLTSLVVSGLQQNMLYFYRVRAMSATAVSGNSNTILLVTGISGSSILDPWGSIQSSGNPGRPSATSQAVGALDGKISVDNHGAANYSIPLKSLPGRGGMEPSLSLNHSSGVSNGPLGMGWSLGTGFPQAITRGRTIFARDGEVRGVHFDSGDKFYLDGKRLLCVSGSEGAAGSTYRTEVDSFLEITTTGINGAIDTFIATDKNGRKFYFGKYLTTTDGFQIGARSTLSDLIDLDVTRAYAYALKRVEDAVGNSVDFTYHSVRTVAGTELGEYVPFEINYTNTTSNVGGAARVRFAYNTALVAGQTERLDRTISYIANRRFSHSRRLDGISIERKEDSGYSQIGYYSLTYEYAPNQGRLRLTGVTPILRNPADADFVSLAATEFGWSSNSQTSGDAWTPTSLGQNGGSQIAKEGYRTQAFGDFDGDGRDDHVDVQNGLDVRLATSTGLGAATSWAAGPLPANLNGYRSVFVGDLDGDGMKDLVLAGVNSQYLYAARSTGNGFSSPVFITDTNEMFGATPVLWGNEKGGTGDRVTVADYTGDGRDDILVHGYNGHVYLFASTSENQAVSFAQRSQSAAAGQACDEERITAWYLRWVGYSIRSFGIHPMPCDLNGDGLTDYVWVETDADPPKPIGFSYFIMKTIKYRLARPGGTFSDECQFGPPAINSATVGSLTVDDLLFSVLPGDFNGDGLPDFLVLRGLQQAAGDPDTRWIMMSSLGENTSGMIQPGITSHSVIPATIEKNGEQLPTIYKPITPRAFTSKYHFYDGPNGSAVVGAARTFGSITANLSQGARALDVNHDGLTDFVFYVYQSDQPYESGNEEPSVNRGWWVMYSNGNGFSDATKLTGEPWDASIPLTYPANTANGGLSTASISPGPDINGDGLSDLFVYTSATSESAQLTDGLRGWSLQRGWTEADGLAGDLITEIANGLDARTTLRYTAAKDLAIYTPGAPVNYPIRELRSSAPVVSDIWHDAGNGILADRTHVAYQYSGNRIDLAGRGSLGFHSFVTLDMLTSVFKYQFLTQSFPMTGLTHREETYRYLGPNSFNIISSRDNTVVFDRVAIGTGATLWPFISRSVESRWEDGEGPLSTSGSGPASKSENLFLLPRPTGAHINIKAESLFDDQTAVQTYLPGGYHPSDVDGSNNIVSGAATQSAFNALLTALNGSDYGKITHGNLKKLTTDFGDGFTETVETDYFDPTSNCITGLVETVNTTVTSPGYDTETAPTKSYTYWQNNTTSLVATETINATGSALDLTTTYSRDTRGRVTAIDIEGANLLHEGQSSTSIRTYAATDFDDDFDLPTVEKNAYGHETTTVYSPFFGKPTSVTDVNGAEITTTYDALGRVTKIVDILKDLQTETAFALDTSQPVTPPAGVIGLALTSAFRTKTTTIAKPAITTYYDRLGRVIRTIRENFSGSTVTDTIYNRLGQIVAVSNPYPSDGTKYWTKTTYDDLGRVETVTAPNDTVTTTTYKGRATAVSVDAPMLGGVNPPAQVNSTVVDARGRTIRVWNADNVPTFSDSLGTTTTTASVAFALDGFGRMRETTLRGQSQSVAATYDGLGRQTALDDPDKGNWSYVNSPLGHVLRQTDARQNVTTTTYDALGRPLIRTTDEASSGPAETAKWYYYDNAGAALGATTKQQTVTFSTKGWIGALQREESATQNATGYAGVDTNSETKTVYYYDDKGRRSINLAAIDGRWFYTHTDYDAYSRVSGVRHYWRPAGKEQPGQSPYVWQDFGYTYAYDEKSYLLSITDSLNRKWWQVDESSGYDHLDRVTLVQKGNGHWTQRTYREKDGVLTGIATGPTIGSSTIQDLSFDYSGLGNLTQRESGSVLENLTYDDLNRLKTSKQGTINYDDIGNITSKPDVGGSTVAITDYDPSHPHAASTYTFNSQTFSITYDANGNLDTRTGGGSTWSMSWTGFDKPRWMAKTTGSATAGSEFLYNANRSRTVQLEFDEMSGGKPSRYVRKRIYGLGSTLEANYEAKTPSASPTWDLKKVRIYVPGPEGVIGAREFDVTLPSGGTEKAYVYHYDHLGSIDVITKFGEVSGIAADTASHTGRFSEDAWGQRRDPLDWSGPPVSTDDGGHDSLTPRGFTGHEMLDDLGLVHMNGRIYDPLLGRMLSADILVPNPSDLQSYNRYSYVRNNPLTLTDPSGFTESDEEARRRKEAEEAARRQRIEEEANGTSARDIIVGGMSVGNSTAAAGASSTAADSAGATGTPVKDKTDTVGVRSRDGAKLDKEGNAKKPDAPESAAAGPATRGTAEKETFADYPKRGIVPRGCTVGVVLNLYWKQGVRLPQDVLLNAISKQTGIPADRVGKDKGVAFDDAVGAINSELKAYGYRAGTRISELASDKQQLIEQYGAIGLVIAASDGRPHAVMYDGANMYTGENPTTDGRAEVIPQTYQDMYNQQRSNYALVLIKL